MAKVFLNTCINDFWRNDNWLESGLKVLPLSFTMPLALRKENEATVDFELMFRTCFRKDSLIKIFDVVEVYAHATKYQIIML